MWEDFLINYLASVAAGITLASLGFMVYKIYQDTSQSTNVTQDNKSGGNVVTNITKQYNINTTEKQTDEVVKKILTKYDS